MGSIANTDTRDRRPTLWASGVHPRCSIKLDWIVIFNNDLLITSNPIECPSPHSYTLLLPSAVICPYRAPKARNKREWDKSYKGTEGVFRG